MKSNDTEALVARYYAAFNARDFDAYAGLFHPEATISAPGVSAQGVDAVRGFDRGWLTAFPEARIETFRMASAAGTVVAGNWFHAGPHRGVLRMAAGDIAPTGKQAGGPYCAMFELEGQRIKRQTLIFEPFWIALQLGVAR